MRPATCRPTIVREKTSGTHVTYTQPDSEEIRAKAEALP